MYSPIEVGKRLKELRLKAKKTQDEIANDVGITRGAYSMYERGQRTPSPDLMIGLANAFGRTVQHVFFFGQNPTK